MEAPLVPWLAALTGRLIGYDDSLLRRVSTVFVAAAVGLFGWLALRRLSPLPALFAFAFFAGNPIVQAMATAMQPEGVALFFTVLTVMAALFWYESGSRRWWWVAVAGLSLALIAKASSVYLLIFCGLLVWQREGVAALLNRRVLLSVGVALAAPLLWYLHARGVYARTGLSLGLSNETHLINAGVLADPLPFFMGNLVIEARYVLATIAGVLLCLLGMFRRSQRPVLLLAASVAVYYLLISDTSGEHWAWYYHLASVVPVSLLVGAGVESVLAHLVDRSRFIVAILVAGLIAVCLWALLGEARVTRRLLEVRDGTSPLTRLCIQELADKLPTGALMLVRGGPAFDVHGHPVAYNDSPPFAWARRFGANFPSDLTQADPFASYANRPAPWYWIARADDSALVDDYPRLVEAAAGYPVVATCSLDRRYALVSLTTTGQARP